MRNLEDQRLRVVVDVVVEAVGAAADAVGIGQVRVAGGHVGLVGGVGGVERQTNAGCARAGDVRDVVVVLDPSRDLQEEVRWPSMSCMWIRL